MEVSTQRTSQDLDISEDNSLNFKKLLYTFLQYWPWFLGSVILCMLTGFLYLRYTTPVYNINSKILIKDDKSGPAASSTDILSQLDIFNNQNNVNNEKAVLQTYYLVSKVVPELQLNVSYFVAGNIKLTELYDKSPFKIHLLYIKDSTHTQKFNFRFSNNGQAFTIQNNNINRKYQLSDTIKTNDISFTVQSANISMRNNTDYQVVITTADAATTKYLKALSFNINDNQASVIEITLKETVPKKGEDILNKLYEVYTRMNEEDKNKIADSTINFIDERLAVVSTELSGVEKDIEQFKVSNHLYADLPEQATLVLNNANDVQKQLTAQDVQISVMQSLEDHLKGSGERIVPNAGVIQDPTYITTVQEYNTLVLERDRQLETTKPDNPVVQNLNGQISTVKKNLLISLENIKKQMQIAKNELVNKNAQLLGEIKTGPEKERVFLDKSRQQDVKQQLYLYLLQKKEETAISKSGSLSNSTLIEPGKSDTLPFTPQKLLICLVALCSGILLPTGIIYLKNLLNNKVTDSTDITKDTAVPILGGLGHNSTGKPLVAEQSSRTALAEQFRALRTNLQFLLRGKEQQIVMVTSSISGEGKTFATINLGASLALTNKKIVLLELDLRKPKLSKGLGMPNEKGFTNYMISGSTKEELLQRTSIHPNLYLISSGDIPPNPAELLLDSKTGELFEWLKTRFDYILIDTPPAGIVIDAVLIAKYANACIYIIRQGYTLKDHLKLVNEFYRQEKMPNLSILLNDVQVKRTYGYSYKYGYSYGNGYASDYYTDGRKKKRSLFGKTKRN